jgi:exodeoxyribonuclease-3
MRIATWNINGLRARLELVQMWLKDRQPDVVGFQELKTPDDKFPYDVFEELGYHAIVHGQKSWNGVAILTREPAELVGKGLPGQDAFGSRLVTARVGGLNFTTVYCPNGKNLEHEDYKNKLAWYDDLIQHWSATQPADELGVICGDFNIVPTALDTWDPERHAGDIFHTDAERERLAKLIDLGLVDLFRETYPEEQAFSWWDYRGGSFHRKHGLRIDFILGTPSVHAKLKSVEIDREYRKKQEGLTASDHAPVIADLDI